MNRKAFLTGAASAALALACLPACSSDSGTDLPAPPTAANATLAIPDGQEVAPNQPGGGDAVSGGEETPDVNNVPAGGNDQVGGAMAGAAGAGGMDVTPPPAVNAASSVLTPDATFWVDGSTNDVGIQGPFFELTDANSGGATVIDSFTVDPATNTICVAGTASQVVDDDYTTFWGGGIGFQLSNPGGAGAAGQPWDRAGGAVTAFSFELSGPTIPPDLRFGVTLAGDNGNYCVPTLAAGAREIALADVQEDCWAPVGAMPGGDMLGLQWQVATVTAAATPFDFCISNVTAVVGQ